MMTSAHLYTVPNFPSPYKLGGLVALVDHPGERILHPRLRRLLWRNLPVMNSASVSAAIFRYSHLSVHISSLIHGFLRFCTFFPTFLSVIPVPFLYADTHFMVFSVFLPFNGEKFVVNSINPYNALVGYTNDYSRMD